jgi:hypothetical protein
MSFSGMKKRIQSVFLARGTDLLSQLRQPLNWNRFGLIDLESIVKYEGNWYVLEL